MTDERILKLAEDLYYDEDKSFCPICKLLKEDCNTCIVIDFHKEFVDLEKAKEYFGSHNTQLGRVGRNVKTGNGRD